MGCWRVVKISTLPPGVKPITCKWVLKFKFANGVYEKHKARIVARPADLDVLSSLVDVPEGNRVYPSCPHSIVMLIVVQYVDNSGIHYNCRELVDEFYAVVRDDGHIYLNFVGGLTWWFGVHYTYDLVTGAASADQEAFIDKLLEQYTQTNCNPCELPMAVGVDLASIPLPDVPDKDIVAAYAKLVGELLYISINTVSEIMYALSTLTRFMTSATSQYYGVKQVLGYLKGVKHLKITWCAQTVKSPFQRGRLFGFADVSWADDKSSLHSTLCYVLCCNGTTFSWKSTLAPILTLSTRKAELISVSSCTQEVNFCRKLASKPGFIHPGPTPIAEDNTSVIALVERGHFKGRSKHVHLRWCFVCDYIDTGILRLVQTPTRDQLTDLGTKACPDPQLKFQRSLLHGGL
jgi:hypothetical protein